MSGMSGESYMESDFYNDSAYTQDISTKMRVPDRLTAHGGVPGYKKRTPGQLTISTVCLKVIRATGIPTLWRRLQDTCTVCRWVFVTKYFEMEQRRSHFASLLLTCAVS